MMKQEKAIIEWKVEKITKVINTFKWLIDAYVMDFHVKNHWDKLPTSCQSLEEYSLNSLKLFCDIQVPVDKNQSVESTLKDDGLEDCCVLPLSLLAIRVLTEQLCVLRTQVVEKPEGNKSSKLLNDLKRRVKPKKLHEISQILPLCKELSDNCSVNTVVDFGSGLGHLARHLAFTSQINVCCIEQETTLVNEAKKIDCEVYQKYLKYAKGNPIMPGKVLHVNKCLTMDTDFEEILMQIPNIVPNFNKRVGFIGLHPCGDLANLLLKIFLKQKEIKFLMIVGCCYMKLTTESTYLMEGRKPSNSSNEFSYPMSAFLKSLGKNLYNLSYEALELAPHAIERHMTEILQNNYTSCKIHTYRAVLENIIVKYWPDKKHSGLKSVRYVPDLSFADYCTKAVAGLNIIIPEADINSNMTENNLNQWKRVAIFYTLRQFFASFIESLILYDRQLFLMENGFSCKVIPMFDSMISSRCHITTAIKPF